MVVYRTRVGNQRQVTGSHFSMVTDNYRPILLKNSFRRFELKIKGFKKAVI
jgi:hypothetical protein